MYTAGLCGEGKKEGMLFVDRGGLSHGVRCCGRESMSGLITSTWVTRKGDALCTVVVCGREGKNGGRQRVEERRL